MNTAPHIQNAPPRILAESFLRQWTKMREANIASGSEHSWSQPSQYNTGLANYSIMSQVQFNFSDPLIWKNEELEHEFYVLVKQWEKQTSFHSSLGEIFTHDAYQRIMAMGRDALPLILSDLQKNPRHWFYALEKIVGRDVAAGAKSFGDARSVWLEWGYKNNYI